MPPPLTPERVISYPPMPAGPGPDTMAGPPNNLFAAFCMCYFDGVDTANPVDIGNSHLHPLPARAIPRIVSPFFTLPRGQVA